MPSTKYTSKPSTPASSDSLKRTRSKTEQSLKQATLGFSSAKRTASAGSLTKGKPTGSLKSRSSSAIPSVRKDVIDLSNDSASDDEERIVFEAEDDEGRVLGRDEEDVGPPVKRRRVQASRGAKAKAVFDSREGEENVVPEHSPERRGSKKAPKVNVEKGANASAEGLDEKVLDEKVHLNVKDRRWRKHFGVVREKMGHLEPIHAEGQNTVDHILRVFDLSYEYGPCIGVTRLERWERAEALGLNPPSEVKQILLTKEGSDDDRYSQCVFYGEV